MLKLLAIIFGLLFILFAAFQYNDPDPEVWIPIYGMAAVACFMAYAGVGRWWFFTAMAVMYIVAAVYQWPPQFEGFLFSEMGMRSMNIEMAREAGGLAICALVMIILAFLVRRQPLRR
ncbi:transmembrane 220 family protein [Spirosoma sp. BT702]|uniref:Transmembrane 220 family protein n=1 Tax=Spirosoma profusum TaxID=2771354 RepID=A0A926Y3G3_9BACT|nr:transmembrane 220 family protein [Spirosoma profusum]MBD2701781.1 transmembrane 220 family protein [Spirosoma profusum]